VIATPRLLLRDWRDEDVEPFIRHTNTEPVMRWLGGVLPEARMREAIAGRMMRWQRERGFTFWVVERKGDGELLGLCGLKYSDDAGSPVEGALEIAWRLREDAWGQGYAKEAAAAALDYGFEQLGADRIVALTVQANAPSWGLMERLGMTRREDLDFEGAHWAEAPVIVYEMRREQWRS